MCVIIHNGMKEEEEEEKKQQPAKQENYKQALKAK